VLVVQEGCRCSVVHLFGLGERDRERCHYLFQDLVSGHAWFQNRKEQGGIVPGVRVDQREKDMMQGWCRLVISH
jgi:hypothetical protein